MSPIHRRQYALYGVALTVLKLILDWLICRQTGFAWTPWLYWQPFQVGLTQASRQHPDVALALTASAVPFVAIGIWLTLRRLYTLQLPHWLLFLFFLPAVNLLFFLYLTMLREYDSDRLKQQAVTLYSGFETGMIVSAISCVAIGFSVASMGSYGLGAFVGVPFGIGVLSTLLYCRKEVHTYAACAAVALFSMALCGGALLLVAMEGLICLLMSAPLAIPLVLLGVLVGRAVILPARVQRQAMLFALLIPTITPLIAAGEQLAKIIDETRAVITTIEVDAPPQQVWQNIIAFPDLPQEREWLFHTGIAYPIRARIAGSGVGAIRYCEFSTGPFVEPITAWQPPHLLAFDVASSPEPMQELSPYDIHPSHLHGFIRSQRGQFRLIELDGGRRTRLEGTTWYQQSLYPAAYWQMLTDAIIHRIHLRVLHHIRRRSEASNAGHKLN